MKTFNNLFLPKFYFSPSVFITIYVWLVYVHFLDFTNNKSGDYLVRFVIVTLVFLISIIFTFITVLLFIRLDKKFQPYVLLISVIISAGIRGYLLDLFLNQFLIDAESRPVFRIASSILNFTLAAVLATIANGKIREHAVNVQKLVREQYRLAYVEKVTKENLQEFNEKQVEPIKNQLLVSLKTLKNQNVDQALVTIRTTIDEIVQPLSRRLDERISQWNPPEIEQKATKINWRKAITQAAVPTEIDPKITPVILSFIGIPTLVSNYGQQTGLIIVLQSLVTGFFIYVLVKKVIEKILHGFFGFIFILLISGLMQASLTLIWSYRIDASLNLLLLTPGAAVVVGYFIASVNTASRQLNEVLLDISQTTKDLSWGVSRIRNEQHQKSRSLGRKLHGEIQARFSSAFLMLQNNQNDPEKANLLVKELANNLEQDVLKLDETNTQTQNLDEVLENVKETWQGLASIKFEADETLKNKIQKDFLCQTALVDIIPELCFNSIKHGKASEVNVVLEQNGPNTVLLKVKDNGNSAPVNSKKGLGTKLMEECAISWKREKEQDQIVTSAEFALSA